MRTETWLALIVALTAHAFAATINKPLPVRDSDPSLQKLVNGVGLKQANDYIGDSYYWVPSSKLYYATRLITPQGKSRFDTWQFKMTLARSTCSKSSTPFSSIANCKVDPKFNSQKVCTAYVSYDEQNIDATLEAEVHCQ